MAGQESLGKAELVLTVNDKALRDGIRDAKKFISNELGQAFTVGKGTSGRGKQGSGEKRFSDRAQATQVITRRLGDQLQRLADRGVDVTREFAALDRAGAALNKGLVEVARAQNRGVADFIRNERRKQAEAKQTRKTEIAEGRRIGRLNVSPILGGAVFPESPKRRARDFNIGKNWGTFLRDLQDTARVIEEGRRTSAQYRGVKSGNIKRNWALFLDDLQDTANVIEENRRTSAQYRTIKDGSIKRNWAKFLEDLQDTAELIKATNKAQGTKDFDAAEKERIRVRNARRRNTLRQIAAEEADTRARRQRRQGRVSSALVGGAFPLLFGQGPGAALGGAAGGFAGGGPLGFGLSLVGTLIGQAFDVAATKGRELASALQNPINNLNQLTTTSVLSSKSVEKQVTALSESGRAAEAATLAQMDLLATYNDLSNLEELVKAQDELDRTFAKLQVSVGNFVAGPLAELLKGINKTLKQPEEGPSTLSRSLGLTAGALALGGGVAAATGLGAPLGVGLLAAGGIAAVGAELTATPNVDPAKAIASMEKQLKLLMLSKEQKRLSLDIDKARLQIASTEDVILSKRLEKARLELEQKRAISALGEDPQQALVEKVRTDYAERILRVEQEISKEIARRLEKQRKAAADLVNLRLQNLKFLPEAEKQGLLREQLGPAIKRARLQGIPLRSISEARDFRSFEIEQQRLRSEAGPQLINSNSQLNGSLQSTVEVVRVLTASMDSLQKKNWEVHVTIPGQNGTKAGIDAVSGLSS